MTESKKMNSVRKPGMKTRALPRDRGRALGRQLAERARLKKAGLRQVGFHIDPDLWKRFKVKVVRDRLTITQVATAMIELFVQGGFNVEKTSDQADQK